MRFTVLALAAFSAALLVPAAARADQTFSNTTGINILDSDGTGPAAADPYPSSISVSGITGNVTAVTATLQGFSHFCPQDVDVLLVGPTGADTVLMSDAGDCQDGTEHPPIDLTFSDSAASAIPCTTTPGTLLSGGTYQPQNWPDSDCATNNPDWAEHWVSPAPAGPWPVSMSGFAGKDPNGTWNLYVVDDSNGDAGAIHGGWSLSLTTAPASNPQPTPGPTGPPAPPHFSAKPRLTQSILKAHAVLISFKSSTGGKLVATGTVSVPGAAKTYRFVTLKKTVQAGTTQVKLKLPRLALSAIKRALAKHRKLSARITLTLTAPDGAKAAKKLTVRLR